MSEAAKQKPAVPDLRDWFAAQALPAVLESRETRDFDDAARMALRDRRRHARRLSTRR